jgi:uncharacterized protein
MLRHHVAAFVIGLIFGFGLLVSGMANPAKVLAFLDLAGAWDPSLALVIGGAIAVGLVAFTLAGRRDRSLLGDPMRLPTRRELDAPLILGSLGFGIGWGLVGFCPGPALVALGAGEVKALVFVAAMVAGMGLFEVIERQRARQAAVPGR